MRFLVTGGTGLIGSRVVRDLVMAGDEVVAYDIRVDEEAMDMLFSKAERAKVRLVQGDILDFDMLLATCKDNELDAIIHMAYVMPLETQADPRKAALVDTGGAINVFETARLLGLKKVVWASSCAVFNRSIYGNRWIGNDALLCPSGLYGAGKAYAEYLSDYYFDEFKVDITGLRYGAMIFGAVQKRGGASLFTRELMINPALGKPGKILHGDGTISWLYVDDASRAAVLASKYPRKKTRAYNIMGELYSARELADYVKELLPDADIELLPGKDPAPPWKYETTVIETEIGFRNLWTVKQGIKETINMTRQQNGLPPI